MQAIIIYSGLNVKGMPLYWTTVEGVRGDVHGGLS